MARGRQSAEPPRTVHATLFQEWCSKASVLKKHHEGGGRARPRTAVTRFTAHPFTAYRAPVPRERARERAQDLEYVECLEYVEYVECMECVEYVEYVESLEYVQYMEYVEYVEYIYIYIFFFCSTTNNGGSHAEHELSEATAQTWQSAMQ